MAFFCAEIQGFVRLVSPQVPFCGPAGLSQRFQVAGESNESFFVVCLNTKNEVLLVKKIHLGFCNQVITDMKILFATILQTGALSFICAHNHPSGDVLPSEEDKELTNKISQASRLLDLHFLDHVIVSIDKYYSFQQDTVMF